METMTKEEKLRSQIGKAMDRLIISKLAKIKIVEKELKKLQTEVRELMRINQYIARGGE